MGMGGVRLWMRDMGEFAPFSEVVVRFGWMVC